MPDRRRQVSGGEPGTPQWLKLGPHFSYKVDPAYVVLSGMSVDRLADELDPTNAAKDMVQATSASKPTYNATGGTPSGRPSITFDGIDDWLELNGGGDLLFGSSSLTAYVGIRRLVNSVQQTVAGCGGNTTNDNIRQALDVNSPPGDQSVANYAGVPTVPRVAPRAVGTSYALEFLHDLSGPTLLVNNGVAEDIRAGAGLSPTALLASMGARYNAGVMQNFGNVEVLWWLGYPRVLTAGERSIARAAVEGWLA